METDEKVYRDLQKHLDKQAVGFPPTKSGVEIRLLKELFNPEQARLALHLTFSPRSARDVLNSLGESGISLDKVKTMLEEMENNGAIASTLKNGTEHYFTIPLLIGIVELHGSKATPQFMADFGEYTGKEYGKAYAATKVSQMRTIPVEKSLRVEQHVTTYDHIREVINNTEGPITIHTCMCREGARKRGQPCRVTARQETCMGFGDWAKREVKAGTAKVITRDQALEIIRQNQADGLVLQPTNYQKIDFICSCCGCCCGVLKIQKALPKPALNWAHNFHAAVDIEKCTACGICAQKCQVIAAVIDEQAGHSTIDLDRCIGCGNCVASCPSEAITLVKVDSEVIPPEDAPGLYKILVEK